MKKSKILMPLTGIAAIGAFAPVIAMTSCGNKNEYKLVDTSSIKVGNFIQEATTYEASTFTNRIGSESLTKAIKAGGLLTFNLFYKYVAPLNNQHYFKYSIPATGSKGKEGTAFYVNATESTEFQGQGETFEGLEIDDLVYVNEDKCNVLATEKKTESFTVAITFREYSDSKCETLVGAQTINVTLVACPALYDLPVLDTTTTALSGSCASTTDVTLAGWAFTAAVNADVKVAIKDGISWPLTGTLGSDTYTLTVDGTKAYTVPEKSTAISYKGTLDKVIASGSKVEFAVEEDTMTLIMTTDPTVYVEKTWEVDANVSTITVEGK